MKSTGRFTQRLSELTHYSHDRCSKCGSKLQQGIPSYAGYDSQGIEIYVGDCCKREIDELASHTYWWWENYERPTDTTQMWRYMDFSKFVALLNNRALFLSRADLLGDSFEGARGVASREEKWREFCENYFRDAILTAPRNTSPPTEKEVEEGIVRLYEDFKTLGKEELQRTFVTCWHANDSESEALWRLYCPPGTTGIAIRTHFKNIKNSINGDELVKFGFVQYIDFKKQFAGTYDRIFWKRISLKHEQEIRGVAISPMHESVERSGISISVNLSTLIEEVVVSPFSPDWFTQTLKATMKQFGLKVPISSSELLDQPFF